MAYATNSKSHADFIKNLQENCTTTPNVIYSVNKVTIFAKNSNDYDKVIKALITGNTPYHTYTPAWKKPKQLVLKGLDGLTEKEATIAIKELGFACEKDFCRGCGPKQSKRN